MQRIVDFLDGRKTFIGASIVFIAGGALALGWIDEKTFKTIVALAGSFTAYGLRVAIKKIQ